MEYEERRFFALADRFPWSWPREADATPRTRISSPDGPRALRPGEVLLLSCREVGGTPRDGRVWSLRLRARAEATAVASVPFDDDRPWQDALARVASALPMLWRPSRPHLPGEAGSFRVLEASAPRAIRFVPQVEGEASVLSGRSYGLSFLLAQASLLTETSLELDVAASATLGIGGSLGRVEGLEAKVAALVQHAPQVRRLLVAAGQAEEALTFVPRAADGRALLEVVPCTRATDAVRLALPDLEARWAALAGGERAERLDDLFLFALSDRHETTNWAAVRRAAQCALENWLSLGPDDRTKLSLVRGFAARHDGENVELEIPSAVFFSGLREPSRTVLGAHLAQQAADTGRPEHAAALALVGQFERRGGEAFVEHLRLLGARGRLLAAMGDHQGALADQVEAARGWLGRRGERGISYPLGELFRLAAALREPETLAIADGLRMEAVARALLAPDDDPWFDAPRARALLAVGQVDRALAAAVPLSGPHFHEHDALPWRHVAARARRAAAVRLGQQSHVVSVDTWIASGLAGASRARAAALVANDQHAAEEAANLERTFATSRAMIALDVARDSAAETSALAELERLQPDHLRNLRCAALKMPEVGVAEYVRRFYPYL